MEFRFTKDPLEKVPAELVFVVCFEKESEKLVSTTLQKSDGGEALDKVLDSQISKTIRAQKFSAKEGESLLFNTFGKTKARALLVVGAGTEKNFSLETLRRIGGKVTQAVNNIKGDSVGVVVEPATIKGMPASERLQAFVEGVLLANYSFDCFKQKEKQVPKTLQTFWFHSKGNSKSLQSACETAQIMAEAANVARDLTNRPPNDLTPTMLAEAALAQAKANKNISCKVFGPKEIKSQKMGAILAVSQGSKEPPRFVHLSYKPVGKSKGKIALVGKGITFDSGGLNIKTRDQEYMKFDMAGAAAVVGVFHALAKLKPKVQVEGFIAAAENMPSGSAIRPGDIIKTRAGKTVEIVNTDAEGRLVLADALDYALEFKPNYMIDMATLTGGAAYALGELWTPILGNDKQLVDRLLKAGKKAGEPSWELPIVQDYKKGYLKGPADLKNSGSGSKASTIAGALFLEEFVKKNKWVHMDIASTVWADEPTFYYTMEGATGNPVRTILYFLMGI